jgi:hypothetical protein
MLTLHRLGHRLVAEQSLTETLEECGHDAHCAASVHLSIRLALLIRLGLAWSFSNWRRTIPIEATHDPSPRRLSGPTWAEFVVAQAKGLIKRFGLGFRNRKNYRIRALHYAGKPNWRVLGSIVVR